MIILDFYGLPGSGKSTISHLLGEELRKKGYIVEEPSWETDRLSSKKRLCNKLLNGIIFSLKHLNLMINIMEQSGNSKKFTSQSIKLWINTSYIMESATRKSNCDIRIFDQGIVQAVVSLYTESSKESYLQCYSELHDLVNEYLLPIYVRVEENTVLERMSKRKSGKSRAEKLNFDERKMMINKIKKLCESFSLDFLDYNNDSSVLNVEELRSKVIERWNKMSKYFIRLDDACEKRDVRNWERIEKILDKYDVKPLVGIIPNCKDVMMEKYEKDTEFWDRVNIWKEKGWSIAMHGYEHVYSTSDGGINPVNKRSEFAGEPLDVQKQKIKDGLNILKNHGFNPKIFFAPSHTFDENTIIALKEESNIKIISDTIANKPYKKSDMIFIPQQSGTVRKLPFSVVTFCYHPNTMKEKDFVILEEFLQKNSIKFDKIDEEFVTARKISYLDKILKRLYFFKRRK